MRPARVPGDFASGTDALLVSLGSNAVGVGVAAGAVLRGRVLQGVLGRGLVMPGAFQVSPDEEGHPGGDQQRGGAHAPLAQPGHERAEPAAYEGGGWSGSKPVVSVSGRVNRPWAVTGAMARRRPSRLRTAAAATVEVSRSRQATSHAGASSTVVALAPSPPSSPRGTSGSAGQQTAQAPTTAPTFRAPCCGSRRTVQQRRDQWCGAFGSGDVQGDVTGGSQGQRAAENAQHPCLRAHSRAPRAASP